MVEVKVIFDGDYIYVGKYRVLVTQGDSFEVIGEEKLFSCLEEVVCFCFGQDYES